MVPLMSHLLRRHASSVLQGASSAAPPISPRCSGIIDNITKRTLYQRVCAIGTSGDAVFFGGLSRFTPQHKVQPQQPRRQLHTTLPCPWSLKQLHELGGKPPRQTKTKSPLSGYPQLRGTVLKVLIMHPRKPNSGNRKGVLVRLTNGKTAKARIPGEGHNLQEHSQVLVQGVGSRHGLIGLHLKVIRGKLDCAPVIKK